MLVYDSIWIFKHKMRKTTDNMLIIVGNTTPEAKRNGERQIETCFRYHVRIRDIK
jgi:hypothetical protein